MYTAEKINALLEKNDAAVVKALQTVKSVTGFNGNDANFGNSLLQYLDERGNLTERQLAAARNMMKRYAAVLARVANDKLKQNQPVPVPVKEKETPNWDEMERKVIEAEMKAEREAEKAAQRYYERQNEPTVNIDW